MEDIGIATYLFNRSVRRDQTQTLLDLPGVCAGLGVRTIELVSSFFASQDARYLQQVRAALEAHNLRVPGIAVDMGDIANADEAARRTDLEALKQWFHLARAIGASAIRINSGAARPDDQAALARITSGYRELAEEAAHTGVFLVIENHGGASADPANIRAFLEGVGSPWFRACPDTGNFPGDTWEEGMRVMAPYAISTHVKVYQYSPDGEQRWTDHTGQDRAYNLRRSLAILKEAGYTGPLCIESAATDSEVEARGEVATARDAIDYVRGLVAAL